MTNIFKEIIEWYERKKFNQVEKKTLNLSEIYHCDRDNIVLKDEYKYDYQVGMQSAPMEIGRFFTTSWELVDHYAELQNYTITTYSLHAKNVIEIDARKQWYSKIKLTKKDVVPNVYYSLFKKWCNLGNEIIVKTDHISLIVSKFNQSNPSNIIDAIIIKNVIEDGKILSDDIIIYDKNVIQKI